MAIRENPTDHSLRYRDGAGRIRVLVGPVADVDGRGPALVTVDSLSADAAAATPSTPVATRLPGVDGTTVALTNELSGTTFLGVVDAEFILPAADVAGIHFYIVTGVASAGTGVTVTADGSDTIIGAGAAANGVFTNSGGSDVIGDSLHIVSDGAGQWVVVSSRGTWASS